MEKIRFERPQGVITQLKFGSDNVYLVEQDGRVIVIDTGKTAYRDELFEAIGDVTIDAIVLTHGHFDHVQNADALSKAYGAPVALAQADRAIVPHNDAQPSMKSAGFLGFILKCKSASEFKNEIIDPFEVAADLAEGVSLSQFGIDAEIVALPGHTQGSIGIDLWGSDFFCGDALINVSSPRKAMIFQDAEARENSAKRITALGSRTIHFGHGDAVENRLW